MIDGDEAWLRRAKSLDRGRSCRWHCCGEGRGAIVSAGERGWSLFCFRDESHNQFERYPEPSMGERLARMTRLQAADAVAEGQHVPTLPQGSAEPSTWPLAARVWLYKAGLFDSDIRRLGAVWSDDLERVVIPVYKDGKLAYWQARNVAGDKRPKYINPSVDRSRLVYKAPEQNSKLLVLTEDILSAYKISTAGFDAWSLMGTKVNDYALDGVMRAVRPNGDRSLVCWLDPDAAGQAGSSSIRRTLRAYGIDARNVVSRADPKRLSRREIRECLNC